MLDLLQVADNLQFDAAGIWQAKASAPISYPASGHAACFQVEDESFWFQHRNACLVAAMQRLPPAGALFDVGAGNGFVAAGLRDAGIDVVAVEPGEVGARHCRQRGLESVICASLHEAHFKEHSLPAVGLFDVLEHQQDDIGFLQQLHRVLKPGGRLYLTVPTYPWLWSAEDTYAGHFRRYTRHTLCQALQRAGFTTQYSSYFFALLPLPIFLLRALPGRLGLPRPISQKTHSREHRGARGVSNLLRWELAALRRGVTLPFGASLLVVAQTPGAS